MKREGNRNFGVWNAPTGMDSVRRSVQVDLELILRLNNRRPIVEALVVRQNLDLSALNDTTNSIILVGEDLGVFSRMRLAGWSHDKPR